MTRRDRWPAVLAMAVGLFATIGLASPAAAQLIEFPVVTPGDLGTAVLGGTVNGSFDVGNTAGEPDLVITGITKQTKAGDDCTDFTVTATFPITVVQATTEPVTVDFAAATAGTFTCTLRFVSNDQAGGQDEFQVQATATSAPDIAANPLDFGPVPLGTPSTLSVTVNNDGDQTLNISNIAVSGADAGDFVPTPTGAVTIAVPAGMSTTVDVQFTPSAAGARVASLDLTSDDPDEMVFGVALTGVGGQPEIDVNPLVVNFGDQRVGVASTAMTVTIDNLGDAPLTVADLILGGTDAGDFSTTPADGVGVNIVIPAMGSQDVDIVFTPGALGLRSATLTINSDDGDEGTVVVDLDGNGVEPDINVAPVALTFPDQRVGTPSAPMTVTIDNLGTSDLTVTDISIVGANAGDFSANPTGPQTLVIPAGMNAMVDVTFTPGAIGARSATLEITSDSPGETLQTVTLDGNGVEPDIAANPISVTFADQVVGVPSGPQTVLIENNGSSDLTVSNIALSGANAGDFSANPTGPQTLVIPAGMSAMVDVVFNPSAPGARLASLDITSDDPDTLTLSVPLDGNGLQQDITVSALAVNFGDQRNGVPSAPMTVTITNVGTADLLITDISVLGGDAGDFLATPSQLPMVTLAPTQSMDVDIVFTPGGLGARSSTLEISSDDPDEMLVMVTLDGNGVEPDIAVAPPSLTFGQVVVGDTSASQPVTITNNGGFPLTITNLALSGANPGEFMFTPATVGPIAANGGMATIDVTCMPSGPGNLMASLDITSDDPDTMVSSVALDCTGMEEPVMVLSETLLDFGDVPVGTPSMLPFDVLNTAGAFGLPLNVTNVQVVNGDVADFSVNLTSFQVDAGNFQTVVVTFNPTALGTRMAEIQVTSDDPVNPVQTVMVTGVGRQANIDVNPLALMFGTVLVGDTSAAQTITVTNTGNDTLTITDVSFATGAAYALVGNTSTTIPAGGMETWDVTCAPPAAGPYPDTLTFTSNAANNPSVAVSLDCDGSNAELSTNPSPIALPDTYIGDASGPVSVAIISELSTDITVTAITVTSNVYTVGGTTSFVLSGVGDSQTITIDFTPVANQPYPATLEVTTVEHGVIPFAVTGRGVESIMEIRAGGVTNPTSHDFGPVKTFTSSPPQTFTIQNVGTYQFTLSAVTVNNTEDFEVTPLGGLVTLQPSESVDVEITAHPRMVGIRTGTVTVQTDIRGSMTATFGVVVEGTSGDIEFSDTTLSFGPVDVQGNLPATRTLTITNPAATATDVLEILDIVLTGDVIRYSLAPGQGTSASLGIGESFDVVVEYTPTVESAGDNAMLTITTDAASAFTSQIPITGRGIDRHIQVAAMTVNFPETVRNPETPAQETVAIANTGEATLAISMLVTGGQDAAAFTIVNPVMQIAPQSSEDLIIEFAPDAVNASYSATVTIVNDDSDQPMVELTLLGAGVLPNIALAGPPVGMVAMTTGEGVPLRLSDLETGPIMLQNLDGSATFRVADVRAVTMDGSDSDVFRVVDFQPDTQIAAGQELAIDVELLSDTPGTYDGVIEVYLGNDPERVAFLALQGRVVAIDVRGGCDAGAVGTGNGSERWGAFLLILMTLGLMGWRRMRAHRALAPARRGGCFFLLAVLALATFDASTARAQDAYNIDLTTFRPVPSAESSMLSVENPSVGDNGAWSVGLSLDHAVDPMTVRAIDDTMEVVDKPVAARTAASLMFSYGFLDRFEAGLAMPILQQSGDDPTITGVMPANGTAVGDLGVNLKAAIVQAGPISLAGSALVTIPTASNGMYAGVEGPSVHTRAIAGFSLARLQLAVNAGFLVRKENTLGDLEQGSALSYGLAARYRVSNRVSAVGELFGVLGLGAEESAAVSPAEVAFGLRYRASQSISLNLGTGVGLPSGAGSPRVRGIFMFSYAFGASEYKPLPRIKRRKPTAQDQDADGVLDKVDQCLDEPEDEDLYEDGDGCPEWDNDEDGIDDTLDKCPLRPEDKDGFEDEDGCPDLDNDGDKVLDADDKCPNVPEDKDGHQDLDGCDDPDNDSDGVPDVIDMCVLEPETINGNKDDDGCPDEGDGLVMLMADRLELFEPIQFRGDSARLTKRSENILSQVAATLRAQSDILKVRIGVHVHPQNRKDKARSRERANAVRDWLVKLGILPERIEIRAYGSEQPLVPRKQRGAKAINDRVEFVILEKAIQ